VWPALLALPPPIAQQLEIEATYHVYAVRQHLEIQALQREENALLPADMDYADISGLSNEIRDRLVAARPATLGQASRIYGMTPAALGLLLVHARKGRVKANAKSSRAV